MRGSMFFSADFLFFLLLFPPLPLPPASAPPFLLSWDTLRHVALGPLLLPQELSDFCARGRCQFCAFLWVVWVVQKCLAFSRTTARGCMLMLCLFSSFSISSFSFSFLQLVRGFRSVGFYFDVLLVLFVLFLFIIFYVSLVTVVFKMFSFFWPVAFFSFWIFNLFRVTSYLFLVVCFSCVLTSTCFVLLVSYCFWPLSSYFFYLWLIIWFFLLHTCHFSLLIHWSPLTS